MLSRINKIAPEYYLIASVLFYWFFTSNLFNPIVIGLLVILGLQLVFKKRFSGIAIGLLFLLLNILMVLALVAELLEFTQFTSGFYELLIVGLLYLALNILVSVMMIMNYSGIKRGND